MVQNIVLHYEHKDLTWMDLCREDCHQETDVIHQIIDNESKLELTFPETIIPPMNGKPNSSRLYLGLTFGGVEIDLNGALAKTRALSLKFKLKKNLKSRILADWDRHFQSTVCVVIFFRMKSDLSKLDATNDTQLLWWSFSAFMDAVSMSLRRVHLWLMACALCLITICILCSLGPNGYLSKPALGLVIGLILIVSCLAGYSVQLTGATHLNAAAFPAFFVLTGIGLIILFSLEGSWTKYSNVACDPVEKLSLILSWDGPCAVLSSLIIIVPFLIIGSSTVNPYLQYVSFVTAAGVAVLLMFAVLFFVVFLYVTGRRETCGVKWYQCWRVGDNQFAPRQMKQFSEASLIALHDKMTEQRSSSIHSMTASVSKPYMKVPIAFIFAIYLMLACWGYKDLHIDLKEEYFMSSDTEAYQFVETYRHMFGHFEQYLELIFTEPIDYHDAHRKAALLEILEWPVRDQYASRSISWLKDFIRFESTTIYDINQDTFVPIVNLVFLGTDIYRKYRTDVVFDKYQTQIVASKMFIELNERGVSDCTGVIREILSKARAAGLPLTIRAPFLFMIQHDLQLFSTVLVSFAILMCCICVFSLVLCGIPSLSALVLFSNLSVMLGVIGFCPHWNVPINIVTLCTALSGNALTTVIVAYFCYNYANAGKIQKSVKQKVVYSFQTCLFPTTLACIVPLVTYIPLLWLDIPIVTHVWKVLVFTSLISLLHFLLFLPNMMVFFTEQVPSLWVSLQERCENYCCYCYDMEEDSGSIYFIPTGGHDMDAEHMARFASISTPQIGRGVLVSALPPGYLQVSPPVLIPDVLTCQKSYSGYPSLNRYKTRRLSDPVICTQFSPRPSSPKLITSINESHSKSSNDTKLSNSTVRQSDAIYEEPPSPSQRRSALSIDAIGPQCRSYQQRSPSATIPTRKLLTSNNVCNTMSFPPGDCCDSPTEQRQIISYSNTNKQYSVDGSNASHGESKTTDTAIKVRSGWGQYLLEDSLRSNGEGQIATAQPVVLYPTSTSHGDDFLSTRMSRNITERTQRL
ncbi:hypothetical protein AB6A40_005475 [Gnathostoma spinigerum]|uniref:SSD domain-containing protein n=1 Tax=Gnathostoma spinigerum TaxID=75299 RepID=A0ABD6EHR9_9BILA